MYRYPLSIMLLVCSSLYSLAQTTAAPDPKTPAYGHNPTAGKYYELRHFRMYCEEYGQGTPILLIHGNSRSIEDFKYQIPFFAKTNRVIIADSRAQGRSVDLSDSLTYEQMADDLNALLDAKKLDSVQVIGWSDGAINGMLLAIRHPEKVKKLVIVGGNTSSDTTAVNAALLKLVQTDYQQLKNKPNLTAEDKNKLKLRGMVLGQPNIPVWELERIQCPTLIVSGDHDVINLEHTVMMSRHISKSNLWIIPDAGHSSPLVRKDLFNTTVNDFFIKPYKAPSLMDRVLN